MTRAKSRVRVVRARGRRELRVDGSFASSFAKGAMATGGVWDALAIGWCALPARRARTAHVLLLGLGAGSVARLLRALAPRARLVGVERDAQVLAHARRSFGLGALGVEVVHGDAARFLARTRRRFDLIVEDCFVGAEAQLRKPAGFPVPALARAAARLAPGGVLVSNTLDETAVVTCVLRAHFRRVLCLSLTDYDNRVLLAGRALPSARVLRARVAANTHFARVLPLLAFRSAKF